MVSSKSDERPTVAGSAGGTGRSSSLNDSTKLNVSRFEPAACKIVAHLALNDRLCQTMHQLDSVGNGAIFCRVAAAMQSSPRCIDPELAALADAWSDLVEAVRANILELAGRVAGR